ncbi:MAG: ankyrin repeat domain-containing protein [Puniceicoccales bacterium]|jgi:hypothetical protein|nr:ankyrin repeat domain-containing protein [Puniceicoccales bacterium]
MRNKVLLPGLCATLFLSEALAVTWGKWSQEHDDTWLATNFSRGDKISKTYCSYRRPGGDPIEAKPYAHLRFAIINPSQLCLPASSDNLYHLGGYFSLPEEIKAWLWRLGAVIETEDQIEFARPLSVTYAMYLGISPHGSPQLLWHCKTLSSCLAAIKRIPFLGSREFDFASKADQNEDSKRPLVASLPNGFFLRKMHSNGLNPQETPWWTAEITRPVDTTGGATILVHDTGMVEVIVEVFSSKIRKTFENLVAQSNIDIGMAIDAMLHPYIVSRKVIDHLYTPGEHRNIAPAYLKLLIEENRIADLQAIISKGNDNVDIDIPGIAPSLSGEGTTTVLHLAVHRNHLETVELLLEKTSLRDKINEHDTSFRQTPLEMAFTREAPFTQEEKPMVKLLRKYGAKGSPSAGGSSGK